MFKKSKYNSSGQKSCPKCSQKSGKFVFYDQQYFGFSKKRITKNNPKGIQSYCKSCRSEK